jgi:hypothetical protein
VCAGISSAHHPAHHSNTGSACRDHLADVIRFYSGNADHWDAGLANQRA